MMRKLNLTKEWDFVCNETTQRRCQFKHKRDILTKELLFALQLLFNHYSDIGGDERKKNFLAIVYKKSKAEYLSRINQN